MLLAGTERPRSSASAHWGIVCAGRGRGAGATDPARAPPQDQPDPRPYLPEHNISVLYSQQKCYVSYLKSSEAKRYLTKIGCEFRPGKGGHLIVLLGDRRSVLPMHGKNELKKGTWEAILKQLGLK
jgi:mRNA interferase HicA